MKIVVDTNIVFSAILNSNSKIGSIILQPKSKYSFYGTEQLLIELSNHYEKLVELSKNRRSKIEQIRTIILSKIKIINTELIPTFVYLDAFNLVKDIDEDDTEFVALSIYTKGMLWSGDKKLINGLLRKGWNKVITTNDFVFSNKCNL